MKLKVCIVVGKYYQDATDDLIKGATSLLDKYKKLEYKILQVPGVFEIPLVISTNIKKYNAFIALGCVIKGETPHFDLITNAAINGIMHLSIKHQKPITNGIVTCLNKDQAKERCNPNKKNKGGEAAQALLHLLDISKNQNESK